MINLGDKKADELVEISKNLGIITFCMKEVTDESTLKKFEKDYQVHKWCERARLHKGFYLRNLKKMYAKIDNLYQELFEKDRRTYLEEKIANRRGYLDEKIN